MEVNSIKFSVIKSSARIARILFLFIISQMIFSILYIIMMLLIRGSQVSEMTFESEMLGIPLILASLTNIFIVYCFRKRVYFVKDIMYSSKTISLPLILLIIPIIFTIDNFTLLLDYILSQFNISIMKSYEATFNQIVYTPYNIIYIGILGPIAEEVMFRGAVLRTFLPYGRNFAILSSSLLFGLMHCDPLQLISAGLAGVMLAVITIQYGMRWSIVIHIFNNLVLSIGVEMLNEQSQIYLNYVSYLCPLVLGISCYYYRHHIKAYWQAGRVNFSVYKYWLTSKMMLAWLALTIIITLFSLI